ncbi:MAG: M14 family metallopeptidase [Lachnospiraceae bacterium]
MKEEILFETKSIYRDSLRVKGMVFGEGEKSACIVGNTRGNEFQQLYTCSRLIKELTRLEEEGRIKDGHSIMVIPSINPYSMNIEKRFWPTDNTDINRMFPGYDKGETTQRIAAGVFEKIKDYKMGMQFTSFYMPGTFIPHVRMMQTGYEDIEGAKLFGLPYVVVRKPRPYDTTTLNYNWQIWGCRAYSVYTSETRSINQETAEQAVRGILNYLSKNDVINYSSHNGYISTVINSDKLVSLKCKNAGIFTGILKTGMPVSRGDVVAEIIDPYSGKILESIISPVNGIIFFMHNSALTYSNVALAKIIPDES